MICHCPAGLFADFGVGMHKWWGLCTSSACTAEGPVFQTKTLHLSRHVPSPKGARGCGRLLGRDGAAYNPAAPDAAASGTGAGAAMAVAAGLADFALGVDHLAGLRVRVAPFTTYSVSTSAGLLL